MKFNIGKKILFVSLCASLLIAPGCKSDSGNSNDNNSPEVVQTAEQRTVSINPGFSALYERTIGGKNTSDVSRQAKDVFDDFIGTMTVTDKDGQNVTNSPFDILVQVNPADWSARMDQTLALFPGTYTVEIDVNRENFRYKGTKTILVADGVDQSHDLSIQPVIADTTVAVGAVTRTRKVTFKYPADQLQQFTAPKIGVTLNSGQERFFTVNKESGETTTLLNLPEGTNTVKLKFFDGSDQLGKSKADQEVIEVGSDPAESFIINLIPLEGRFKFNLAVNGGNAGLTVDLPDEAIAEAAGVDNLQVKASLIQSDLIKYQNETTATGNASAYKADFQFTEVYYGNYILRLEFVDKAEKVTLGSCETVVELDNSSDILPCDNLQLTRTTYTSGDLLGSVHVTVKDQKLHSVTGALIKIDGQTVATTGEDAFGGPSYARFYRKPGSYTLTVTHESGQASRDITVSSLQSGLNLIIKLEQPVTVQTSNRLALGWAHSCFLKEDGTVRCWGNGEDGQIGNGKNDNYNTAPQEVVGLRNPIMLSATSHSTCALTAERNVVCWGRNDNGELAISDITVNSNQPVEIAGLSNVQSIVSGSDHNCALMSDQTVKCWGGNGGDNQYLGVDATADNVFTPQTVVGLQGVKTLTAGINSTCATLTDGTAQCWGGNSFGNLATGNTVNQPAPQTIQALSNAEELKLGAFHGFARFDDGSLMSWGMNGNSQLGHSGENPTMTPQYTLSSLSGVTQLSLGMNFGCALLENGTGQCWGAQYLGALGNGISQENATTPVEIKTADSNTLTGIRELATGVTHNCAWLGGDNVKCWGSNSAGQIGDGTYDEDRGFALDVIGL